MLRILAEEVPEMNFILVAQVTSTWAMVGLIWFVQVVHYPLMGLVGPGFKEYERCHMSRTKWIVAPLMLTELSTNLLLFWRPGGLNRGFLAVGLLLLSAIWLSTFLLQVPQHQRLARGFDVLAHQRLVSSNWLRTFAWTLRGIWALWLLASATPAL
jgi:hypothetical protein